MYPPLQGKVNILCFIRIYCAGVCMYVCKSYSNLFQLIHVAVIRECTQRSCSVKYI